MHLKREGLGVHSIDRGRNGEDGVLTRGAPHHQAALSDCGFSKVQIHGNRDRTAESLGHRHYRSIVRKMSRSKITSAAMWFLRSSGLLLAGR